MKKETLADLLANLYPCDEAVDWLRLYTGADAEKAWNECGQGDWMLWLLGRVEISPPWDEDRKPLLACALDCAGTVEHLWTSEVSSGVAALRGWIDGRQGIAEAKKATNTLRSALVRSAASYAPCYCLEDAYAAYYAANAAANATYAANAAREHASIISAAAASACYAAAYAKRNRNEILSACADIVRRHYPHPPLNAEVN